jgi:hypothetical protein
VCRYAKQGQSRPRRCFYLEDPCDQCEAEEREKIELLCEEREAKKIAGPVLVRINDHQLAESF